MATSLTAPRFPIAPVLEALGAEQVPRVKGPGYRRLACPFHPDTTPSASVSEYGFKCWGCEKSGDAVKLLREEEGIGYADAVRRCEEITGIRSGDAGPEPAPRRALLDF